MLNATGKVVHDSWCLLPNFFPDLRLDAYVVMPNHVHGIIQLLQGNKLDLTQIVRNFKSTSSRKIRKLHPNLNVWQKSFYDRVVRSEVN